MEKKQTEKDLLKLLKQYHHYKFMSGGFLSLFKGWHQRMNLGGFMEWLESRRE